MVKQLIILLLIGFGFQSYAQDVHFSQFNSSYLNLNPALTGSFEGDYRFNANYRNQWASISEPFRTFSATGEAKSLIKSFTGLHLGLSFLNDEAGLGGLTNTQVLVSLSYPLSLNLDSTLILKLGVQSGYSGKKINVNQFSFDQQYNGRFFEPNATNGEAFDRNSFGNFALNTGLSIEKIIGFRKRIELGASLFNLNSQNQSFQGSNIILDRRLSIFAQADYYLSDKIDLLPALLYSSQNKFKELVVGSRIRYRIEGSESNVDALYGGIYYRNKDAIIALLGFDYLNWNFGLSYDVNTSDLITSTNRRGGLEIAITHIFKSFKPSKKRFKVCPNFM